MNQKKVIELLTSALNEMTQTEHSSYYYDYNRNDLERENPFTQYTDEEMDAMCEAAASQQEKEQCYEFNLREAEYYNKRAQLDLHPMLSESKEQIYKNYRAAIDEWNKLNDKYKSLVECHEELQDLFYRVDSELDELKEKYAQSQSNYRVVVKELNKHLNS